MRYLVPHQPSAVVLIDRHSSGVVSVAMGRQDRTKTIVMQKGDNNPISLGRAVVAKPSTVRNKSTTAFGRLGRPPTFGPSCHMAWHAGRVSWPVLHNKWHVRVKTIRRSCTRKVRLLFSESFGLPDSSRFPSGTPLSIFPVGFGDHRPTRSRWSMAGCVGHTHCSVPRRPYWGPLWPKVIKTLTYQLFISMFQI